LRVSREQAAQNRDRVIDTGARLFREKGLDGIGIAELMKASGLTHGGFYGQFESKDALAVECVTRVLGKSAERWRRLLEEASGDPLRTIVEDYLSVRHLNGVETGCAFTTLAADAARRGGAMAQAMSEGMEALADVLQSILPGGGRGRALAVLSQLTGAMTLARATADPALAGEMLMAAREEILARR
jgi:TetR/AcrR family transcriptional regulator, transcriptional repressor for nem operon